MKTCLSKNNKGAALISVVIAVAFISIIATSLMYMSVSNYKMKVHNVNSKKNYYETESALTKTAVGFRNSVLTSSVPEEEVKNFCKGSSLTKDTTADNKYSCSALAKAAFDENEEYIDANGIHLNRYSFNSTNNYMRAVVTDNITDCVYTISSSDSLCKLAYSKDSSNIESYTFKNVLITQENPSGYVNSIKTDFNFKLYANTSDCTVKGGVGELSMLMDAPLDFDGAKYASLVVHGNSFVADYSTVVNNFTVGTTNYGSFTSPGSNAVNLKGNTLCSFVGDYTVVYGDLNIADNTACYVYGNLTVYGNINISGNGALIVCDGGKVMQPDFKLPGRSELCKVSISDNQLAKHLYPSSTTIDACIGVDKYVEFCKTVGLNNSDTSDDGLLYQILNQINLGSEKTIATNFRSINGTNTFSGNYYGKSVGVKFLGEDRINGDSWQNLIIFCMKDNGGKVYMNESPVNSTIFSRYPIVCEQVKGTNLTKIGGEEFNYITAGNNASSIYNNSSNPFISQSIYIQDFINMSGQSKSYGTNYALPNGFGTLFKSDCNKTVNEMFQASVGDGSGSDPSSYVSSFSFDKFVKDFEN